jgi:hypothetical protein
MTAALPRSAEAAWQRAPSSPSRDWGRPRVGEEIQGDLPQLNGIDHYLGKGPCEIRAERDALALEIVSLEGRHVHDESGEIDGFRRGVLLPEHESQPVRR